MSFSLFELVGGVFTGSIAIISDAIHDFGDALSIGISYFLEKKSKKEANDVYTYGYVRYSVLGAVITNTILVVGSVLVIFNAVMRMFNPVLLRPVGMLVFALVGVITNSLAVYYTKDGDSLNQKAVNLHMFEDVLSWLAVLVGALVIKLTGVTVIDSIMSIAVALFILTAALNAFGKILDLFLEKVPDGINTSCVKEHILMLDGIKEISDIHLWSLDGNDCFATMKIITNSADVKTVKTAVKTKLSGLGICHSTLEIDIDT